MKLIEEDVDSGVLGGVNSYTAEQVETQTLEQVVGNVTIHLSNLVDVQIYHQLRYPTRINLFFKM
jgi:hypothetical protein